MALRPIIELDVAFSNSKTIYRNLDLTLRNSKIFVYIKHGNMDEYDLQILEFFRKEKFYILLFSTEYEDSIYADWWQRKKYFGRDSSVLRDLSRILGKSGLKKLELAFFNDSMVWDVREMPKLLAKLRAYPENTLIFPTESMHPVSHTQPYFIYANLDEIHLQKFSTSFEWIKTCHLKRSLVQYVEYRMRDKLETAGWKVESVVKHKELAAIHEGTLWNSKFNPTQHLWKSLPKFGIVGVKRSLVNTNPVNVTDAPRNFEDALKRLKEKPMESGN